MKKLKLLLATCALLLSTGQVWAQTDVTSTYLTNADFTQTTALTGTYLYGYGKDGSPYGFQTIDGWTSVVTAGDNSNNKYPNSGVAGGVFSYGSSTQLKGNAKAAPATNPNGEATGNCFGFFGVWGCGGYYYQDVTLAAGKYTITVPMYNQSGTQANTTYTGFFPTSGTNRTVAVNPTVGQWVNQTVSFTLADDTEGQIRIGYQSTGSGSGANPMLFIDCVKIEFTAIVVKDILETALTAATNANATLKSSDLTAAIATAQAVYDDEDATQEEVNAAAATLNAAVELAMSAAGDVTGVFFSNSGFESCTAEASNVAAKSIKDYSSDGWTNATTGSYTTIAVTAYGGGVKVGDSTTPSTKKDGTTVSGNTLGIIAGWGDNVTIQSDEVALPAGVYTFTVDHYLTSSTSNYDSSSSKFGFVSSSNSYLVSSTTFAASTWTTETVTFTLTESTIGKIQIGLTGLNKSGSGSPAVFYDDITITYKSFLAGAKEAYDEAVAAAEAAKIACPNVTGEELADLNAELAKAEPTTVAGYEEATEAIEAATATLTAAKASYDAYAEANGIATTLEATSVTAPTTADEAVTRAKELYVNIDTKVNSNYFDVTDIYAGDFTGFTATNTGQHWSDDADIAYLDQWGSGTVTATQDITLPAGSYVLKAVGRAAAGEAAKAYMSANGTTVNFANNGDTGKGVDTSGAVNYGDGTFANNDNGRGWEWRFIPVTLAEETTITVNMTLERSSSWGSFCDFTILMSNDGAADSDDYNALNAAITTAEANTLGFEDGEYAPYNNVDALTKLATAKAVNQSGDNVKSIVNNITTALSGATWTANDDDVDAIFNGSFSSNVEGDWGLTAWTRTNPWGQQQTGLSGDYATAYYNQPGSLQYGNQGVYTMPLAANTVYELTVVFRSHENNSNNAMNVSVLNESEEGLARVNLGYNKSKTDWKEAKKWFRTGSAGNYVLTLENDGNTWMTGISLVKAVAENVTISEEESYTPVEKFADVTLNRTIKGDDTWNTFCVPFDITNEELVAKFGEEVAVAEFSDAGESADAITVNFNKMTTPAITANKPVLLKGNAGTSFEFTGKLIKEGEAKVTGKYVDFVGSYAAKFEIPDDDYYLSANKLYRSIGNGSYIMGTRAYIKATSASARIVSLFIDGEEETTAISEKLSVKGEQAAIYNLNGQKMEKQNLRKGLYIVNGKKIVK